MPLSPPAPRKGVHNRSVQCRGYRRDDGLWDIEGHLVDTKSYRFETRWRGEMPPGRPVHEMWLRITVDDDLVIHACEAVMDHHPYDVCCEVVDNFKALTGLRIGPGFIKEVHRRVGKTLGCTHLVELVRPLATTAFQTLVASDRHRARQEVALTDQPPRLLDTCHAHAATSPVTQERWPAFYRESEVS